MATFHAYAAFDMNALNLYFYHAHYEYATLQDNINGPFHGKVYSDIYNFIGNDGTVHRDLWAGGQNLTVSGTAPKSGTVTLLGTTEQQTSFTSWTLENINIDFRDLYLATTTSSRSDDVKLLARALHGSDTIYLSGARDYISGYAGDDVIHGGGGKDRLAGGSGADTFAYKRPSEGGDSIIDFTSVDQLTFSATAFGNLAKKSLTASVFKSVDKLATLSAQEDANDRFIFALDTHTLYFDADGKGGATPSSIAQFLNAYSLHAGDILIV
jgi:Ca2+-binding RTX toxin-like protein